jgi:hypothetical protein
MTRYSPGPVMEEIESAEEINEAIMFAEYELFGVKNIKSKYLTSIGIIKEGS